LRAARARIIVAVPQNRLILRAPDAGSGTQSHVFVFIHAAGGMLAPTIYDSFRSWRMVVMKHLSIAALAALIFLAGCNKSNQNSTTSSAQTPAANAAANAPIPASITGTVTMHDPQAVGAGSKLDVKLVDVAQQEIVVAEKSFDVSGDPPFNFTLDLDPNKISRSRTYVVNVILTDGDRRFMPALNSPVLTGGAGATAQIVVNPEPTPAEKLKEEFTKLQAHIGGMKKVDGTYTTDDASVGWDAFAETGKVRFVRVNTEYDKGGRTSVKYAFKDDKPMFAKQTGGASVGWDDSGNAIVNEKQGGGSLNDKELGPVHDAATKAFEMAQEKVDASKKK
jgi:putative lipoprotein